MRTEAFIHFRIGAFERLENGNRWEISGCRYYCPDCEPRRRPDAEAAVGHAGDGHDANDFGKSMQTNVVQEVKRKDKDGVVGSPLGEWLVRER